jgi:hypothetical protein
MPTLLVHLLLAAATQGFINVFMNLPGISEFSFYAAITAILVDLDHRSDGERSPYIHSLLTVFAVFVIGAAIILLLQDAWMRLLVCSVVVGFVSHISVDAIDRRGLFIAPWKRDQRIILKRSAGGCSSRGRKLYLVIVVLSGLALLIFLLL